MSLQSSDKHARACVSLTSSPAFNWNCLFCREHQAQLEQEKADLLELRQKAAKWATDRDVATRALDDMRAFEARQAMTHSLLKVCIACAFPTA